MKVVEEEFKVVDEKLRSLEQKIDEKFKSLNFKLSLFLAKALIAITFANSAFVALIKKIFWQCAQFHWKPQRMKMPTPIKATREDQQTRKKRPRLKQLDLPVIKDVKSIVDPSQCREDTRDEWGR